MNYINTKVVKNDTQWLIVYNEAFQKDFLGEVKNLCNYLSQSFNNKDLEAIQFDFTQTKTLKVTDLIYLVETLLLLEKQTAGKLKVSIIKYKPLLDLAKLYDLSDVVNKYLIE